MASPSLSTRLVLPTTIAYAAIASADLLDAWRHDPQNRWGIVAFIIWLGSTLISSLAKRSKASGELPFAAIVLAVLLTLGGTLTSLNVLQHAGLAVAIVALARVPALQGFLLTVAAISWMPAAGWMSNFLSLPPADPLRPAIALFPLLPLLILVLTGRRSHD